MIQSKAEAEAVLADSREAVRVLQGLIARLEVYTDRLEGELDRRDGPQGELTGRDDRR